LSRFVALLATLLLCTAAGRAGQLTVGDWDFLGLDCFPDFTQGWTFQVEPGEGVTIISIEATDLGGMMQYDVVYDGGGMVTCSLHNCFSDGDEGATFDCELPNDIFNHYLTDDIVQQMPTTFCGFCEGVEPEPAVELGDAYPNPFSETTLIPITLPEPAQVSLELIDLLGSQAALLLNDWQPAGEHFVSFESGLTLPLGWYFSRLIAGSDTLTASLCLLTRPEQVDQYPPLLTTDVDGEFFLPLEMLPLGLSCEHTDGDGNGLGALSASVVLVVRLEGYRDVICEFQLQQDAVEYPVFVLEEE